MASIGLNTAFTAASALAGVRFDPFLSANFLVEVEGLVVGGFSEVSGLEIELEYEEISEGGGDTHHLPTGTKHSNLVLKRGMTDLDLMWAWQDEINQGVVNPRNGTIFLLDAQHLPAMWWNFSQAFPVKWSGPQLDASSGVVAVETIELVHHGLTKPKSSLALSVSRASARGVVQP